MDCIIDMSDIIEHQNKLPTLEDFKTYNKSGPDVENQLEALDEYHQVIANAKRPPIVKMFFRVNVLSFLPLFGTM
jgi:hypothetical protein